MALAATVQEARRRDKILKHSAHGKELEKAKIKRLEAANKV